MRKPTEQQKAQAEAKRQKLRAFTKQITAMTDEQRLAFIDRIGAIVTVEGRPLSPRNTMLCYLQCMNVSVVGGFQQWIRAGRSVQKGQHGISIWIPCARKSEDGLTEGETFFTSGTVFDISQTEEIQAEAA